MRLGGNQVGIGECVLDAARGVLHRPDGTQAALRPKTAELLCLLAARRGEVVSRADILDAIWPGLHVTDDSITQCVVEIRRALGPAAERLRTIPKRGYLLDVPGGAPPAGPRGVSVVAILPFRLPEPDPRLALFAEGVLDGVVGALAALREPVVISANSTRGFAAPVPDLAAAGRRLGAQYLGMGTLRRHGAGMRLALELAEAETGAVCWRRHWDLPPHISIEAEDEIAAVVAQGLAPRVQEAELRRLRARPTPADPEAYHLLLEARSLVFRLDRAAFEAGGALLRRAVAMDPGFPPAHAALADWHSLRVGQGWSPDPVADFRALEAAAEEALVLDGANARALSLLGHNRAMLHDGHDAALELFERALDAAPNDAEAWMWSAPTHAWLGWGEDAVRRAARAIELSPEDPLRFRFQHFLAIAHYESGDLASAAAWGLRSREANPRYASNLRLTAAALAGLDREAEARRLAGEAILLDPGFRVGPAIERHAARDPHARARLAQRWIAAGLPA